MIMKHFTAYTVLVMLLGSMLQACDAEYKTYSDAEYVLFSDTLSVNMVWQGQEFFTVPVVSTVTCGYDRTFGVEVIGRGSNAVEGGTTACARTASRFLRASGGPTSRSRAFTTTLGRPIRWGSFCRW